VEHDSIDDEFDVIAAFDVIEHIDDDVAAIANMTRMLRSGGALIVSAPQHRFMWRSIDEIVKHKRRYSRMELVDKLVGNGLRIERCTSFVFMLFPLMLASRLLDRKRDEASPTKGPGTESSVANGVEPSVRLVMRIDEVMIGMGLSLRSAERWWWWRGRTRDDGAEDRDQQVRGRRGRELRVDLRDIRAPAEQAPRQPHRLARTAWLFGMFFSYVVNFVWVFRPTDKLTFDSRLRNS